MGDKKGERDTNREVRKRGGADKERGREGGWVTRRGRETQTGR